MNEEKKMTNCPKCGKPILNEGVFTSAARFNMRCPWCQATLEINVKPKIITEVIKLANGEPVIRPAPSGQAVASSPNQASFGLNQITDGNNQPEKPRFKLVGYLYPDDNKPSDTGG